MKKVIIILLIIVIIAGGGFGAYMYFIREKDDKKVPSLYEGLKWGTAYDDVYSNARGRGEKIKKELKTCKDTHCIATERDGYENVDGTVLVGYFVNDTKGLQFVAIYFERDKCEQSLHKIYKSYKKRLDKYYKPCKEMPDYWEDSEGTLYFLFEGDDKVTLSISKKDIDK